MRAIDEGRFENEIVPVPLPDGSEFAVDEHPRRTSTLEKLATLPLLNPFDDGATTTAGNASGLNDAAAALVLTLPGVRRGPRPDAAGGDPGLGLGRRSPRPRPGCSPAHAIRKALAKAGVDQSEVSSSWRSTRRSPRSPSRRSRRSAWIPRIVNVNGSGCSLGHPIGCTGARMIVTMMNELERTDGRYGVVAMCAAGGMGSATVIERL